ncbi:hypothetical protein RND81_14G228800 [Saponaria officinalis]|uniref:Uncharacterized protein n=1 Tax=Saponaria officinalis TaxID=3572 RepID=A0AAW1GST8_SAPOF
MKLRLVRNPSISDKSVLWTASEDQGDGYTFISTTNDDGVVMDASQGYIRDGTIVSINSNVGTETEYWKLSRYGSPYRRLFCRASGRDGFYCVGIQDGKLILTRPVDGDRTQLWCKDSYEIGFVLVHVDTSKLVRYKGVQEQLELVNKPSCLDQSLLWTPSKRDDGILIRTLNNDNVVMDVAKGGIVEGVPVIIGQQSYSMSQTWFFSM